MELLRENIENEEQLEDNSWEMSDIESTDSSVKMYLKEISAYRLLCYEEEKQLGERVQKGLHAMQEMQEMESHLEEYTIEDYEDLKRDIASGKEAKDTLVNCNLRLVVSVAKKFRGCGLDLMDLIQEGSMGLVRAAEKFDPESGFRFSTYASWWIRQSMTRALSDQSRTIRIPVHITEDIRKVNRIRKELYNQLDRNPTDYEICSASGFSMEKLQDLYGIMDKTVSLDTKCGEDEDSVLGDFVADESMKDPQQFTMEQRIKFEINELLTALLTEREKEVIEKRFGLNNIPEHTLEEVAADGENKVTRERIRQIESKALHKLSRSQDFKRLAEAYFGR